MKQPDLFTAHHELNGVQKILEKFQSRSAEASLMPLDCRVVRLRGCQRVIPIPFDCPFTDGLADVDNSL